ncbi:peroxide stress protein YaaA [Temperatibacter marinus]|uniref:UPF0246 protein QGN29_10055 n=1 Tax=Temperatibacter marinus TaxID=1456591 RepID=A0AA52EG44_9PROT|nr:peroxide stress protein YaaA [Temperatibacter marinus]WND01894.1 peroxide stress protein YaaA [Temperatibacter marinus]
MLVVLSPAKKLDFESENFQSGGESPALLGESETLIKVARKLRTEDLKSMMGISDALAELNVARFKAFETPFNTTNARPALDAFKGDVYVGLDAPSMTEQNRAFANEHVRILSGLYGLLKPLDLMQAYRLEMGIKFPTSRGKNLYQFWGDAITNEVNKSLKEGDAVINLASNEYFKSIKPKLLNGPVITPTFKEIKEGKSRVISFLAKKARGLMTRWIIDNQITNPETLKGFALEGYAYDPESSSETQWIFSRQQP